MPTPSGLSAHKIELFIEDDGTIFTMDSLGNLKKMILPGGIWRSVKTTTSGQTYVEFTDIPTNLEVLDLCWSANVIDGGGDMALLSARFTTSIEDIEEEFFSHLHLINPDGTTFEYTDDLSPWETDTSMFLGLLNRWGLTNCWSTGRSQFPNYAQMDDGDGIYGSPVSHGNGQVILSGYTPAVYIAGSWCQGRLGPVDRIMLRAFDLDVSPLETGEDWIPGEPTGAIAFHENSRFILTGFRS